MRRFLSVGYITLLLSGTLAADEVFYHIKFSGPLNTVGQIPAVGDTTDRVSRISFGSPIVSRELGALTDQPLVFNTAGNQPHYYYDQILLKVRKEARFYYVAFDLYTQYLIGSPNHFSILFDTPRIRTIRFDRDGMIRAFVPHEPTQDICPFQDISLMHFQMYLDMNQGTWTVFVNDRKAYAGAFNPLEDIHSIRFSLGLESSGSQPYHDTIVGLDNIIVADYIVDKMAVILCRPLADAGEDQRVTADSDGVATVVLDGTTSYDPDGLELHYKWSWVIGRVRRYAFGKTATIKLPVGPHTIQLTVDNGKYRSQTDETMILVSGELPAKVR